MGFIRKAVRGAAFVSTGGMTGVTGFPVKGNSKKERIANATEAQLQLMARDGKAENQRRKHDQIATGNQIAPGIWWLDEKAFKGLSAGFGCYYLGGWVPFTKERSKTVTDTLYFAEKGISLKSIRTLLTIPWPEVQALVVEDPQLSRRIECEETLKDYSLHKSGKRAILAVQLSRGKEVTFLVNRLDKIDVEEKLAVVIASVSNGQRIRNEFSGSSAAVFNRLGVADELAKLASLRDSGVINDDEFASQKAKLLEG